MLVLYQDKIVERDQVMIDMEDRGYEFGDGLYEMVRLYNGHFYMLAEHLDRFYAGAQKIEMVIPYSRAQLTGLLLELAQKNQIKTGNVYFQMTRGVSRRDHRYPNPLEVEGVLTGKAFEQPRQAQSFVTGQKAITYPDERWLHCDIKSISLLGNIMAKHQAHKANCDEAILYRSPTEVTEGSATNAWLIKNGVVKTHPNNHLILGGITKMALIEAIKKQGIAFEEKVFSLKELKNADEIFISSTTLEAMPIVQLDGQKIGNGICGPITAKIQKAYLEAVEEICGKIKE